MKRRLKKRQRLPRSERTFKTRNKDESKALEELDVWKQTVREKVRSPNFNVQQYKDGEEIIVLAEFWHHSA